MVEYKVVKCVGTDDYMLIAEKESVFPSSDKLMQVIGTYPTYEKAVFAWKYALLMDGDSISCSMYLPIRLVNMVDDMRFTGGRKRSRSDVFKEILVEYFMNHHIDEIKYDD